MPRFIFALFLTLIITQPIPAQVVINEVQSSNSETISDEDGEYEDWVELYNTGNEPINLNGYGLSDDYDNPFRWTFPSVTIGSGEYLLIWASGKNRSEPGGELHTNFSIQRDGEEVLLTLPDGTLIDELEPTHIPRDLSYGRYPDGTGDFYYFTEPTPGSENNTEAFNELLEPPVFSHPGGQYPGSIQLELESESNADIYYTTDRSEPTRENAERYSGPISINRTTVVRARSFKDGAVPSQQATKLYTLLGGSTHGFNSNLPVLILSEFNNEIVPDVRSPAWLTVLDNQESGRAALTSDPDLQTFVMANKRGSSSLSFPKNMFSFHMIDEDGSNLNEPLLELPPEHNWILYAPYTDATLMRNVVSYSLSEKMGWYAPRTKYVELYLHTGDGPLTDEHYYGVYVLTERIKWDENRVDITKITPGDNSEPEITGGYIIKKDRLNAGESGIRTRRGTGLAYARPNEMDVTSAQHQWITNYMSDFEEALFSPDFADPVHGYQSFINVESFIDHFLITELLKEIDGYRLSTFMYKDRGEKLVMGPLWDFNLSLGIANYMDGWIPEGWYYPVPRRDNDCFVGCGIVEWYERLMEDESYWEQTQERWWELRQNLFSKEYLSSFIDQNAELLDEAQHRNFERWPNSIGSYVWPNWYVGDSYYDEVEWMKEWLMARVDWIDSQMGDPPAIPETETIHYWRFDDELPNNTPFESLSASYSTHSSGLIEYSSSLSGYPFDSNHPNWRKASMERRNMPTPLNYRPDLFGEEEYSEEEMRALQVRQPFRQGSLENEIIFHLPTGSEPYEGYLFRFAAKDEGAAENLLIDYSLGEDDSGWTTENLSETSLNITENYQLFEIDLSAVGGVENNPGFKLRIRFDGSDMTVDQGNRVTFNNISFDGITGFSGLPDVKEEIPHMATLDQNYPNPFNSSTTIRFGIPNSGFVELSIFNILGQRITTLVNETRSAGFHEAVFDASNLSSGVYLYRLTTERSVETRKLMLVK